MCSGPFLWGTSMGVFEARGAAARSKIHSTVLENLGVWMGGKWVVPFEAWRHRTPPPLPATFSCQKSFLGWGMT